MGNIAITDILSMKTKDLLATMQQGYPIKIDSLDNTEYKGISLSLPKIIEKLTWKKFKKVFYRDEERDVLRGWNIRIEQNDLDAPYVPMMKGGKEKTFGHYQVHPLWWYVPKSDIITGLMIDYGLGGNALLDPMGLSKDPLVAVNKGSNKLLLGYTYLDMGAIRMNTPTFFSLERDCKLTHVVEPPRS